MHDNLTVENQDIYISNGTIQQIAATGHSVNEHVTTIDGSGLFAIPGLWDSHIHMLAFDSGQATEDTESTLTQTHARATALLKQMLQSGITTAVDMGMDISQIPVAKMLKGDPEVPHLLFSGPLITGPKSPWSKPIEAHLDNTEAAIALLDTLNVHDVDFIKTYDGITMDLLATVAEKANELNLPVAGHIPFAVSTKDAVDLGLRSIQHTYLQLVKDCTDLGNNASFAPLSAWMREGYEGRWRVSSEIYRSRDKSECTALYQQLAQSNVYLVATPQLDLPLAMVVDEHVLQSLGSDQREGCKTTLAEQASASELVVQNRKQDLIEHYRELINAGVKIVAGSDAPNDCMGFGPSLIASIELFTTLGLSPYEALQTATTNAANMFGTSDRAGLEVGNIADLVLLKSNPLQNISALREIDSIVLRGKVTSLPSDKTTNDSMH